MTQRILRGVLWNDLPADQSVAVDNDWTSQVHRGLTGAIKCDDVEDECVLGTCQAKELDVAGRNVGLIIWEHLTGGKNHKRPFRPRRHLQPHEGFLAGFGEQDVAFDLFESKNPERD